jgi:hypothetical protein
MKGCERVHFPERSEPWNQKDIVSPSLNRRHFYTQKRRRIVQLGGQQVSLQMT